MARVVDLRVHYKDTPKLRIHLQAPSVVMALGVDTLNGVGLNTSAACTHSRAVGMDPAASFRTAMAAGRLRDLDCNRRGVA